MKGKRNSGPSRIPKLLFLDHCSVVGGAQISRKAIYLHLLEMGFRVGEIVPSSRSIFPLRVKRKPLGLLSLIANTGYCFFRFLVEGRPHWYCNSILDRLQCILIPPRYLITHIRDLPGPGQVRLLKGLPSRAYVVSSNFMKERVNQSAPFARRVHVVPNIVDVPAGCTGDKTPLVPFRVLMVANLVPWKNHLLAVEAMGWLAKNRISVQLDIWGSDPMGENRAFRESLLNRIQSVPGSCVRLLEGRRIRAENYRQYHCLLHPAESEPFGRVLVEAILNGLPIVGPDSGNVGELVRNYHVGNLYAGNRAESVGKAILSLFSHYPDFREKTLEAQAVVRRDHSGPAAIQALIRTGTLPEEFFRVADFGMP